MTASWARRLLTFLTGLACALLATPAHAEHVKVLFVAQQATPFSARVRAEIEAMGFDLVSSDLLDEQGRSATKAAAYVIETPPPRRVELWLQSAASGRLELSAVVQASASDAAPSDEAAETVQASEQLRAFFQPLQAPRASPEGPPAGTALPQSATPSISVRRPPGRLRARVASPSHFFEELALALPLEPGSVGVDALVRGGAWVLPRWAVGGKLDIPVQASTVRSGVNAASVSATLIGAELSRLLVDARALRLLARAGLALAWLHASGEASAPYTNRSDSALAALPSLAAQLELPVAEHWRLALGAELGVALPKLEIAFAGQPVAPWARPLGLLSAGISFDL